MPLILCADCDGKSPYQQTRNLFVCTACGHSVIPADIDLDGAEVLTVTQSGLLGYIDRGLE